MKTNSKQVRAAMRQHILECVTDDDGNNFATFDEAAERLKSEFHRVADYPNNLKKFPNNQERFHDYLMGIPFGFEFTNFGIACFLESLEIGKNGVKYNEEKSARLYTSLIFREIA